MDQNTSEIKTSILQKAYEFASIGYAGIKRNTGEDYINHAMRVKKYLEDVKITDEIILAAALLHDLPKLHAATIEEIEKEFGEEVAFIVQTLQEINQISIPKNKKNENIKQMHKLIIQLSKDIRVLLIKLADRIDNVKTSDGIPQDEREWSALKARLIYAPIAKATGIYTFARELDDESLRILEPERYKKIVTYQNKKFKQIEKDLIIAKHKIEEFLKSINESEYEISFRKKGIYSTHLKAIYAQKKYEHIHTDDAFDSLFDLLGIRIIVKSVDACYKILGYIQKEWPNLQEEFDDYIAKPKPNGYRSLQTAIHIKPGYKCEVQIRTAEMHHHNEFGQASHFSYKYGKGKNSPVTWIQDLISAKDNIQKSLSNESKINLFEDTIFAFTPNGDLITLPKDSTALDFAYAIHTNIGNCCSGVLINGKIAPINTIIKSGDKIEVLTHKNKKPSSKAIESVKTHEAKKAIKKALGLI